jgi:toxin-antitoxin system PIN domain toxin
MLNFLDVNVLLALLWDRHVHSELARQWFDQTSDGECGFCRFAQLTVLRLLTTESVMGSDSRSMAAAWTAWDVLGADSRLLFVAEPAAIEIELRSRSRLPSRSPKVWADAYLLAFASAAGLRLVTFDRSLRSRGADALIL